MANLYLLSFAHLHGPRAVFLKLLRAIKVFEVSAAYLPGGLRDMEWFLVDMVFTFV